MHVSSATLDFPTGATRGPAPADGHHANRRE